MRENHSIHHKWALLVVLLMLLASSLFIQAADKIPSLSPKTYKVLQSTQEMLDAGKSAQALKRLDQLVTETAKRPYEQAVALQTLAHAHIDLGDYASAIPYLKRSLGLQALPEEAQQRSRYNLAQLYMATEKFALAIDQLGIWFKQAKTPKAEAYLLLGSAHLQLNQYKSAIPPLRKAIKLSNKPQESWYQSLLGAYSETKNYAQSVKLLHSMLVLFPDTSSYWRQLAGFELLQQHFSQALAAMELAYLRGHLTEERDLLNLVQLYIERDAPYKAARLIEREIKNNRIKSNRKNWEMAANAWYQAKQTDQTIEALKKALAQGNDEEISLRLARLYLETQRWSDAQELLRRILQQNGTKGHAQAWLLLGIACYEDDSMEMAKSAFSKAKKYQKTQRDAEQWLAFLARQN